MISTIENNYRPKAQQRLYDIVSTNDYIQYANDKIQKRCCNADTKLALPRAVNGIVNKPHYGL